MYSFGLCSLVTMKPTHITKISATLIDNIFTKWIKNEFSSGVICSDISDHMPIFCVKRASVVNSEKRDGKVTKGLINDERTSRFKQHLTEIDWQALPPLFPSYCHTHAASSKVSCRLNIFVLFFLSIQEVSICCFNIGSWSVGVGDG